MSKYTSDLNMYWNRWLAREAHQDQCKHRSNHGKRLPIARKEDDLVVHKLAQRVQPWDAVDELRHAQAGRKPLQTYNKHANNAKDIHGRECWKRTALKHTIKL